MGIERVAFEDVRVRVLPDGRVKLADAAKYIGVSDKTLANLKTQGKGPPVKKVGGRNFCLLPDLEAYVARGGDRLTRDGKSTVGSGSADSSGFGDDKSR